MENLSNLICSSQYIENHPILKERFIFKSSYLSVLQYFVERYCNTRKFSVSLIQLYKDKILGSENREYYYESNKLNQSFKFASRKKLKNYKFISYRYTLMIDCLFLCCFDDVALADIVFIELKKLFKPRFYRKMDVLYQALYYGKNIDISIEMVDYLYDSWMKNKQHALSKQTNILITANMSAGKSTLINAIIGKNICQTKNDACTAKLHYIQSKAFEDNLIYELDHALELNATHTILMDNNDLNETDKIVVGTYFRTNTQNYKRINLIDTPGVNSSQNIEHKTLTEQAIIADEYDKIIYVINGEQIGTDDDRRHLEFIVKTVKTKEIIFVLNKLDKFRHGEDDVESSILSIKKELSEIGFKNVIICPVSAYAGLLAKKKLWGDNLNEDDTEDLAFFVRKFKRAEYDLSQYSSKENQDYGKAIINSSKDETERKMLSLLNESGMFSLEKNIYK